MIDLLTHDEAIKHFRRGSLSYRLVTEDWSKHNANGISSILDINPSALSSLIASIKKRTGYDVPRLRQCRVNKKNPEYKSLRKFLLSEDVSQLTYEQIAELAGCSVKYVYNCVSEISKQGNSLNVAKKRLEYDFNPGIERPNASTFREGTLCWKLLSDDYSDLTLMEIAEVLYYPYSSIRKAITDIRRKTGWTVPHMICRRKCDSSDYE